MSVKRDYEGEFGMWQARSKNSALYLDKFIESGKLDSAFQSSQLESLDELFHRLDYVLRSPDTGSEPTPESIYGCDGLFDLAYLCAVSLGEAEEWLPWNDKAKSQTHLEDIKKYRVIIQKVANGYVAEKEADAVKDCAQFVKNVSRRLDFQIQSLRITRRRH